MIGRLHHVVIDCPDPAALAVFYSELLGLPVTYRSDDWVVIAENDTTSGIAFQLALDYQGAATSLETASLFYLAVILLAFSLGVNVLAQVIVRRTARRQGLVAR